MDDAIISGLAFAFLIACAYGLQLVFRKREMPFTTAMLWVIGGLVVVGIGVGLLTSNKRDSATEISSTSNAASTASPAASVPNTYLGISLGDSEQQVRYVLGESTRVDEKGDLKLLVYGDDDNERGSSFGILTSTNRGGVIQLACQGGDSCPPLLGLEIGDSEERVKSTLGSEIREKLDPNDAPISTSAVMKAISFGENPIATFYLSQRKIVLMVLSENSEQPR